MALGSPVGSRHRGGSVVLIGWFDSNTHVDTPAGDNVEQQYVIEEAGADQPGEADWQNSDGRSLDEIVTEPEIDATVTL